jgi:hypothetical protein
MLNLRRPQPCGDQLGGTSHCDKDFGNEHGSAESGSSDICMILYSQKQKPLGFVSVGAARLHFACTTKYWYSCLPLDNEWGELIKKSTLKILSSSLQFRGNQNSCTHINSTKQ